MKLAISILYILVFSHSLLWADQAKNSHEFSTASAYLKMLSEAKYDLLGTTAISPHCEVSRRKEIRDQLELYYKTSLQKGDNFSLLAEKTQGQFAAILIRSDNSLSPLNVRIHSIAMILRKGKWLPAPIPGSFANSNYGYDAATEKTIQSLEKWMAKEKSDREAQARDKATRKLLNNISEKEQQINLSDLSPEQSVLQLIQAIRSMDAIKALAIMGASAEEVNSALMESVNNITQGLNISEIDNEWNLVKNPTVIVRPLRVDKDKSEVAVGFWDPLAKSEAQILYFPTLKSKGKTFTKLPTVLKVALMGERERDRRRWKLRRNDETQLKKKLPPEIFKNNQPQANSDSKRLLENTLKFYKAGDFTKLLTLIPCEGDFFGTEDNQKKSLLELGSLWRKLNNVKENSLRVLDILEDDKIALAPLQFTKITRPGEFITVHLWMIKQEEGWYLIPENLLSDYGGEDTAKTMEKLMKQLESIQKDQQELHARELMSNVVTLSPLPNLTAPSPEDSKKLLKEFRHHLRAKESLAALRCSAVLKGTDRTQTLRIFNYAIRGASDHSEQDEIIGHTQSGNWLGITLKTTSKSSEMVDYPLYLILTTPNGVKILLDIDLRHATNKGRELLNSRALKKLSNNLPEDSLTEVKKIFKAHQQLSTADILKNNPEKEE